MIIGALESLTDVPMAEVEEMAKAMKEGANPRDYKLRLALEVVSIYKSAKDAQAAKDNFVKVFSQGEKPIEVKSVKVKSRKLSEILLETGLASSNSEAKRLIEQKGVMVDDKIVENMYSELASGKHLIQKGKRFFIKAIVE